MAYDRYDTRDAPRERSRWSDDSSRDRDRGRPDERGFWDRASDEVASWFGDDDAERRRREDQTGNRREQGWSGRERDYDRGYGRDWNRDRDHGRDRGRGDWFETRGLNERGGFSENDYNPSWRRELFRDRDPDRRDSSRDYRPMTGDYSRSQTPWGRDEIRRTEYAGSRDSGWRERDFDPHYRNWRDRHMSDLDRDYDDYRRENQSRFENDFGSWRERRVQKRELLNRIREHMEVVGSDDEHVGTVDKIAGDRIILTKSDPESGGVHHSLSCADLDRIEGDKVILDCTADQARHRWRDENRGRALFERDDQGEMGPRMLDHSFEGTYR